MSSSRDFESLVSLLPVDWDRALGIGISEFINKQDPEDVEFKRGNNGYAIIVRTDDENAEEARQFWLDHVDDKL